MASSRFTMHDQYPRIFFGQENSTQSRRFTMRDHRSILHKNITDLRCKINTHISFSSSSSSSLSLFFFFFFFLFCLFFLFVLPND